MSDDAFNYADDTNYIGDITADVPSEDVKERLRRLYASRPILRWAYREGLVLFEGAPGCKYPLKDFFEDGWAFRPWKGTGPALGLIPPDMVLLDGDTDEGRAAVEKMDLPEHFAIRSKTSDGEKRFFRCQDPPKRMIRALPGLDVLANPGNKAIWAKIDDGSDDGGYEVIGVSEDCPDLPDQVLADLVEAKSSGAGTRSAAVSGYRSPGARWDDDDDLLPTAHYAEHGIPHGLQEDRFFRLADRFAALGKTEDQGTQLLLAIARVSEQDDSDPWTPDQLREKMTRAIDWVATLPPRERGAGDEAGDQDVRILPHPGTPIKVARVLAATEFATGLGLPSLRWHRGGFTRWDGSAWLAEPDSAVEQQLYLICEHAKYEEKDEKDEIRLRSWNPVPSSVASLMKILGVGVLQLPHQLDPPFWITAGTEERNLIPVENGLLDAVSRELRAHTPDYFNAWSLPYRYDPDAPEPADWIKFLGDLWPKETESVEFLQEWMGYLISGDTSQEKVCLLTGPRRGGKGTICKVIIALMGAMNIASPTFTNLTETFGLEPLVDKPLAIIFDARTGSKNIQSAVERMLTISGRDRITVNRKNRTAWEGQLPARLMHVSNELPALRDVAGALASRYIPLTTTRSWLGQEDVGLGARLTTPESLSAILNWALKGLDRLGENGAFTLPAGAEEALKILERLASPEMAWAEACCETGAAFWAKTDALFGSYELWAIQDQRMARTPTKEVFTKNLRAAFPELVPLRKRLEDGKQHYGYTGIKLIEK